MDEIEAREETDILSFFRNKEDVSTEFTLYIAYTSRNGVFDECMRNGALTYASLRGRVDRSKIADTISRIENDNVWCFSVHRRVFRQVRVRTLETIARAWALHLYSGYDEAYSRAEELAHALSDDVNDFNDLRWNELRNGPS